MRRRTCCWASHAAQALLFNETNIMIRKQTIDTVGDEAVWEQSLIYEMDMFSGFSNSLTNEQQSVSTEGALFEWG